MKLRLLYGEKLRTDPAAKRRKMKLLFFVSLPVYPLFLAITYALSLRKGPAQIILMGLLAGLACVPIALISYSVGIEKSWRLLWGERREEMKALALKIGFFYGLEMYALVLGIVEFLFGYHTFRAALISFVALAVARDGFEIGYIRRDENESPAMTVFPDGRSIGAFFKAGSRATFLWIGGAALLGGAFGAWVGASLPSARLQTLFVGTVSAALATLAYAYGSPFRPTLRQATRYFIWPALIMACSYFFISAYLLRILFQLPFAPAADLGLLTALCAGWIMKDTLFLGYLRKSDSGRLGALRTGSLASGPKRLDL